MRNFVDERTLASKLANYRPGLLPGRRRLQRASVALVMRPRAYNAEDLEVLLMHRSQRDGDPWSGHMSFPGGKQSTSDKNALQCALRELREETNMQLNEGDAQPIGRLSDQLTRQHHRNRPMVISAFVFFTSSTQTLSAERSEVNELMWLPLSELCDPANADTLRWKVAGPLAANMPGATVRKHFIWGLSWNMLRELFWVAGVIRKKPRNLLPLI